MPTNPDFYTEPCGFVSYYGDQARQILRQYSEIWHTHYSCRGAHYVVWVEGEFYMKPFGDWAHQRYSFHCILEFIPGEAEPLWCFSVMC